MSHDKILKIEDKVLRGVEQFCDIVTLAKLLLKIFYGSEGKVARRKSEK